MLETLFGGILGGVFRLAPEILKWLDRKDERKHELDMLGAEKDIAVIRGEMALRQAEVHYGEVELDALKGAYAEQAATATAAGKFVAGLSALVRPLVTYWFVILYSLVKLANMTTAFAHGADWKQVLITCWTHDDMAILNFILTFWFVGRTIEKKNGAA